MIRTVRRNGAVHQLIPHSKLSGDFPALIIKDHFFWLQLPPTTKQASAPNVTSRRIDLSNGHNPWEMKEGWFISLSYRATSTRMMLGPDYLLLDIRSPTASMITALLAPLESPEFIDVRYCKKDKTVTAHLPRLKLDFYINHRSRLACKQFPDMTISDDQQIETFVGLENRLVVCQGQTRSVIVPHGKVCFQSQDSNSTVRIDTKDRQRVKYHIYTVNSTLGTLIGNGSLTSHLYKIYLHAVTSHCHPDPLTGRTGTEEALAGLRAAATRSFQVIETDGVDAKLFKLIAALAPERVYYPVHLKRMQRVKWQAGLSPIAQHDEFRQRVRDVAEYARLLTIFEDVKGAIEWQTTGDQCLAKRAAIRNLVFRTEEFGGLVVRKDNDQIYNTRDMGNSVDEARVAYVAGLVVREKSRLNVHPGLLGMLEGLGDILGPSQAAFVNQPALGYDQQWLDPDLSNVWLPLYNALRGHSESTDWMFLLSTMTY